MSNAKRMAHAINAISTGQPTVISAATVLDPLVTDYIVVVPLASADSYTVTLPAPELAKGFMTLHARRASGSYVDGAVTVAGVTATSTFNTSDEFLVLYSNGIKWFIVTDGSGSGS